MSRPCDNTAAAPSRPRCFIGPARSAAERGVRRLRLSYLVALTLVAGLVIGTHVVLDLLITQSRFDALVINDAGRQRMLSQKIARLSLTLESGGRVEDRVALRDAVALWRETHNALPAGDPVAGRRAWAEPDLLARHARLKPHLDAIAEAAAVLDDPAADPIARSGAIDTVLTQQGPFLRQQHALVAALQADAERRMARLLTASRVMLSFTLLLLVAEGLFVFGPVVRAMRRQLGELEAARARLMHQADHDGLTGLPNRATLMRVLAEPAGSSREADAAPEFCLYFLDFDRFKLINDTLGHAYGDLLLRGIAARFRTLAIAAEGERLTLEAYRLGGDEFVAVLRGDQAVGSSEAWADRLVEAFAEPHDLDGQACTSTASVGVLPVRRAGDDPAVLLRDADLAMNRAKACGKSRWVVFDRAMQERVQRRFAVEAALRLSLRGPDGGGSVSLRFQPIFDAAARRAVAVEVLLDWSDPRLGRIGNTELLDVAAATGLMPELGAAVLERAAAASAGWPGVDAGSGRPPALHLNVSRSELLHPGFVTRVEDVLRRWPHLQGRLRLECVGAVGGRGSEAFIAAARRLDAAGVRVGLDNLEREAASLHLLARLPISFLKLGLSGPPSPERLAVLEALAGFGARRGIDVIGCGIETPGALVTALDLGVSSVQGLWLRPPSETLNPTPLLHVAAAA